MISAINSAAASEANGRSAGDADADSRARRGGNAMRQETVGEVANFGHNGAYCALIDDPDHERPCPPEEARLRAAVMVLTVEAARWRLACGWWRACCERMTGLRDQERARSERWQVEALWWRRREGGR